jgi:hypothetical protein
MLGKLDRRRDAVRRQVAAARKEPQGIQKEDCMPKPDSLIERPRRVQKPRILEFLSS